MYTQATFPLRMSKKVGGSLNVHIYKRYPQGEGQKSQDGHQDHAIKARPFFMLLWIPRHAMVAKTHFEPVTFLFLVPFCSFGKVVYSFCLATTIM